MFVKKFSRHSITKLNKYFLFFLNKSWEVKKELIESKLRLEIRSRTTFLKPLAKHNQEQHKQNNKIIYIVSKGD